MGQAPIAYAQKVTADVVILNAHAYTVNAKQPWAEAIAIRGEEIIAVGSAKDVTQYRNAKTKVIDAVKACSAWLHRLPHALLDGG